PLVRLVPRDAARDLRHLLVIEGRLAAGGVLHPQRGEDGGLAHAAPAHRAGQAGPGDVPPALRDPAAAGGGPCRRGRAPPRPGRERGKEPGRGGGRVDLAGPAPVRPLVAPPGPVPAGRHDRLRAPGEQRERALLVAPAVRGGERRVARDRVEQPPPVAAGELKGGRQVAAAEALQLALALGAVHVDADQARRRPAERYPDVGGRDVPPPSPDLLLARRRVLALLPLVEGRLAGAAARLRRPAVPAPDALRHLAVVGRAAGRHRPALQAAVAQGGGQALAPGLHGVNLA